MPRIAPIVTSPPDREPVVDWREAKRLLKKLGTLQAVADRLDTTANTVSRTLRNHGTATQRPRIGSTDLATRRLYANWGWMVRRCTDPSNSSYKYYGARGVRVCREWMDFRRFRAWALSTGWKPGLALILIDPNRDHSPANCRWGTQGETLSLRFRVAPGTPQLVRAFGVQKSAAAWSRDLRCKVAYVPLLRRLQHGWPPEAAISLPPGSTPPRRRVARRAVQTFALPRRTIDWKRAIELHRSGLNPTEVAARLGASVTAIRAGLKRKGVFRPQRRKPSRVADGPLFVAWCGIRRMARGSVPASPEWNDDYDAFRAWARANGYGKGKCIVRIDKARPHGPDNCAVVAFPDRVNFVRAPSKPQRVPKYRIRAFGRALGPTEWSRQRECTVSLTTLLQRLRGGWSPEAAISAEPANRGGLGKFRRRIRAFGEVKSLTQWAADPRCAVVPAALRKRLNRGLSPEDAIAIPPWGRAQQKQATRGQSTGER